MSCQERVKRRIHKLGSSVGETSGPCYLCYLSCTSWIRPHIAKGRLAFYNKRLTPLIRALRYNFGLIFTDLGACNVHWCFILLSKFAFAAGLSCYPSMVSRSQVDLFYSHPLWYHSTWRNKLTLLCSVFLPLHTTDENHLRVKAGGGREPEGRA